MEVISRTGTSGSVNSFAGSVSLRETLQEVLRYAEEDLDMDNKNEPLLVCLDAGEETQLRNIYEQSLWVPATEDEEFNPAPQDLRPVLQFIADRVNQTSAYGKFIPCISIHTRNKEEATVYGWLYVYALRNFKTSEGVEIQVML